MVDARRIAGHLAGGAVTGEKLGGGAVGTDHLGDGAVTGAKLGGSAVTGDKLAAGAVAAGHPPRRATPTVPGGAGSAPQTST